MTTASTHDGKNWKCALKQHHYLLDQTPGPDHGRQVCSHCGHVRSGAPDDRELNPFTRAADQQYSDQARTSMTVYGGSAYGG